MTAATELVIKPFHRQQDRTRFDCSQPSLNRYIKQQASQDIRRAICRIFVAMQLKSSSILGYYTLSALSISVTNLPQDIAKRLPKHPLPAVLIWRLPVDKLAQRQGIGKMLLADAVKRTLTIREELGIYALVVDAIDDYAASFYNRFGFIPFDTSNHRLFLPLKSR